MEGWFEFLISEQLWRWMEPIAEQGTIEQLGKLVQ